MSNNRNGKQWGRFTGIVFEAISALLFLGNGFIDLDKSTLFVISFSLFLFGLHLQYINRVIKRPRKKVYYSPKTRRFTKDKEI